LSAITTRTHQEMT